MDALLLYGLAAGVAAALLGTVFVTHQVALRADSRRIEAAAEAAADERFNEYLDARERDGDPVKNPDPRDSGVWWTGLRAGRDAIAKYLRLARGWRRA